MIRRTMIALVIGMLIAVVAGLVSGVLDFNQRQVYTLTGVDVALTVFFTLVYVASGLGPLALLRLVDRQPEPE